MPAFWWMPEAAINTAVPSLRITIWSPWVHPRHRSFLLLHSMKPTGFTDICCMLQIVRLLRKSITARWNASAASCCKYAAWTRTRSTSSFAASGTDIHLIAAQIAAQNASTLAITVDIAETGSGVPAALAGKHFSSCTALGDQVAQLSQVAGCTTLNVVNIAIRNSDGSPRDTQEVDAEATQLVEKAIAAQQQVLLMLVGRFQDRLDRAQPGMCAGIKASLCGTSTCDGGCMPVPHRSCHLANLSGTGVHGRAHRFPNSFPALHSPAHYCSTSLRTYRVLPA